MVPHYGSTLQGRHVLYIIFIKNIKLTIGSQLIQEYPGEYIRCVAERDFSEEKKKMFDEMTGNNIELTHPENFGGNRFNNYPNVLDI